MRDYALLEFELRYFLNEVLRGDFYERFGVSEANRVKSLGIIIGVALINNEEIAIILKDCIIRSV